MTTSERQFKLKKKVHNIQHWNVEIQFQKNERLDSLPLQETADLA
jgi:hypothetical protein